MPACIKEIDALLPQTQCGECGYNGCRPYAEALVNGSAPIDRCPPGGVAVVQALGKHLDIDATPYLAHAADNTRPPSIAQIKEDECIGCTKCIQACPVDAILGSGQLMHSILPKDCTGCGLCVEPCPVNCITMVELPQPNYDKERAREHFYAKKNRALSEAQEKKQTYLEKRHLAAQARETTQDVRAKQDYILQALARVKAKKNES